MKNDNGLDKTPAWWLFLALPLIHFASVKLTFLCAVTPENEVVVWLPNAVLLAALLRFRGQRGWVMALLTFSSDLVANLPVFAWQEAALLSLVNLVEVLSTFLLMRRAGASGGLERLQDLVKFVIAGPLVSAALAGFMAAAVLGAFGSSGAHGTPYLTLMRLWWFGDALGLLIYTPLLLAFTHPAGEVIRLRWWDVAVALLTMSLAALIFSVHGTQAEATPTLLLPSLLFMAARLGVRWTALSVAVLSLSIARQLVTGGSPLGGVTTYLAVVHAQEFILTLCIVGLGFAVLLRELRNNERSLEEKVRERTREFELANDRLATLSTTDGLTGLANRRHFDDVLASEWVRAKRTGEPLALVLLDVDLFKKYNDRYGHQLGDDCLRTVARVFQANVHRGGDVVARYGGEEFAFIAPATDEAGALVLANAVRQALQDEGVPHETSPFGVVTVSLGVAVIVATEATTPDMLLKRADDALYQAKAQGRNTVVLAGPAEGLAGQVSAPESASAP